MLTVGNGQSVVEGLLGKGLLSCPGCGASWAGGVTRPAGWCLGRAGFRWRCVRGVRGAVRAG